MSEDWVQLQAIFQIFGSICGVLGLMAALYLKSTFVTRASYNLAVEQLRERINACERRHDGTASAIEISKLDVTIATLDGTIRTLEERVRGMGLAFENQSEAVNRIEGYMLARSQS